MALGTLQGKWANCVFLSFRALSGANICCLLPFNVYTSTTLKAFLTEKEKTL